MSDNSKKSRGYKERIIYNSECDYSDANLQEYKKQMRACGAKACQLTRDGLMSCICDDKNEEYENLLYELRLYTAKKPVGKIIAIADLGLWNGRKLGVKYYATIQSIFSVREDEAKWYCDSYNLRSNLSHHDGTNYVLYREIIDEKRVDFLFDKIRNGVAGVTEKDFARCTRSLRPIFKDIYGW